MASMMRRVSVRLSSEDERRLSAACEKYDASPSEVMRLGLMWLVDEEPPLSTVDADALREVAESNRFLAGSVTRVGANLNQVTRALHRRGVNEQALLSTLTDVKKVLNKVLDAVVSDRVCH